MRVLDLFCCAGGAGMGYYSAGFDVIGVDIVERPRYPFAFLQEDALDTLRDLINGYGDIRFVHASPPCQRDCALTKGTNKARRDSYPDLYGPVRDLMYASGIPGVIENPAARPDWVLCGEMFGLGVLRHRNFELVNWSAPAPAHKKHRGRVRGYRHGEWHDGPYVAAYGAGGGKATVPEMQEAMDIHWTSARTELTEAIPPAYTQAVGEAFIRWGQTA
ncbi:DNA methylase [Streptomyces sp. NPDC006540]|uniref:DNA methylase n=1 Tax=Streptomyces sp. NPDC006540 TaxID=3155353 RepID=UPI0033BA2F9C